MPGALALALALAAPPAPACVVPAPDEDVLQHGEVTLGAGEDAVPLVVAAVAVRSEARGETLGVAETELRVWDRECGPVHRQMYGNAAMLRFETARLGGETMLHAVAFYPGGSGHSYRHDLLQLGGWGGELVGVAPMPMVHSNMGGYFVGDLGGARGDGIAMWGADWGSGESHYAPHFADMILYRWDGTGFAGPERLRTAEKVAAEPDAAPEALGLPFRDSTRPEVFEPELAE